MSPANSWYFLPAVVVTSCSTKERIVLPSESVTKKKIKKILKAASYYLYIRNLENLDVRIDAIEVYIKQEKYYINHIKQII